MASAERVHALDAVRASALLLGIVLHGGLSFAVGVDPGLWPVQDRHQSAWMSLAGYVIHIFRMSVFFLVAGLLAHAMFHRLGSAAFWRNRVLRIALPLAISWPVCFAAIGAVVLWVLARGNGGRLPEQIPPELQRGGSSFLHLWFLYLLLWLYALLLALRAGVRRLDPRGRIAAAADGALRVALRSAPASLLLALPIALGFAIEPRWRWWEGVPTPAYSWLPAPLPLFVYGWLFAIGWLIDRQRDALLDALRRGTGWHLGLGIVATLVCLQVTGTQPLAPQAQAGPALRAYAAAYAVALIALTLAVVGAGMRWFAEPSPRVRYLADASYWMYIAHLPLVLALQALLAPLDAPWWLKFAAVAAGSCALLLWTYRVAVRPSWIGALLNGRRHPLGT